MQILCHFAKHYAVLAFLYITIPLNGGKIHQKKAPVIGTKSIFSSLRQQKGDIFSQLKFDRNS